MFQKFTAFIFYSKKIPEKGYINGIKYENITLRYEYRWLGNIVNQVSS